MEDNDIKVGDIITMGTIYMAKRIASDNQAQRDRSVLGAVGKDAGRLRFDTQHDALNYARQIAKDCRGWPIGQLQRFFEGQEESDC